MEDYLDAELRAVLGSMVRDMPEPEKALEAHWEPQESCAEGWLTGQQTVEDKIKRCSPWACLSLGICVMCLIYARCGWVELEQVVPWMLGAMAFGGWKVGRMV